jgi:long-chain acyl-CoA synthetase
MKYQSLGEMFFSNRINYPDKIAYKYKKDNQWIPVTYKEAGEKVEQIAAAFDSMGIRKGDKVAIMSPNKIEWAYTDYAAVSLGAVLVPIYPTLLAGQALYILNDSESKIVIVSDSSQAEKIDDVKDKLEFTKDFYLIDFIEGEESGGWKKFDSLYAKGKTLLQDKNNSVINITDSVRLDNLATIIYTSGTTGEPKGAMLTHKNLLSNIESGSKIFTFYPNDVLISFLPLSHIFERMAGHYLTCYHTVQVAYAESIEKVPENILEIRPTLFISVPRLYEKIYSKVIENVESSNRVKRRIFYWSVKTGKAYIRKIMLHEKIAKLLKIKRKLAFNLVFKKLANKLGGRIRFMISGGAPLSEEIAEFFGAAGLYILEGYGLTETSPAISINRLDNFRYGTVGPLLPEVEVSIAEDGEILSRGNHIMKGYYKKEVETKEAIDEEGWFHTGDIGVIDDQGFLVITDRKKNILVTSGGKNIAPQPIENNLITSKYIEQALVLGDKRNYCTAVIVLAKEQLMQWLNENNIMLDDPDNINSNVHVRELIRTVIDKHSINLARYETIKDFYIAPEEFTIENGMLTPTLKVKRNLVEEKYKFEIDRMYSN